MIIKKMTQYTMENEWIKYQHKDDVLYVTMFLEGEEYKDVFDFSILHGDGEFLIFSSNGEDNIKTKLPINPIMALERIEGILHVEVLDWKLSP